MYTVCACIRITKNLGDRILIPHLVYKTLISVSFIMMSLKKELLASYSSVVMASTFSSAFAYGLSFVGRQLEVLKVCTLGKTCFCEYRPAMASPSAVRLPFLLDRTVLCMYLSSLSKISIVLVINHVGFLYTCSISNPCAC